jgi:endonuclease/exonuclease/phosphatase family metal-dependent hydrolase
MRAALLLALAGCGVDVGAAGPWVPVAQVDAPLAVEVSAPPAALAPATPDTLRVVTYNINEGDLAVAPDAIADAILADPALAAADVVMVQEAEHFAGEPSSRVASIAARLGMGYVYVPAYLKDTDHTHGLAILSAYPIANVDKKDLPMAGPKRRIAVAADIVVGARRLHVIDVHLEMRATAATRIAQLRPAVIDAPDAVLVAGDFNMSWLEWTAADVPILQASSASDQAPVIDSFMTALGFATPTVASGPTAWADGLGARVDAFYPRGLDAAFGGAEQVGPSDHVPLWIDVRLPQ